MTKNEVRQMIKNKSLNEIRKIYNKRFQFQYDEYDNSSCSEQREFRIKCIIEDLENELKNYENTSSKNK